ncbi:MAG: Na/Pi cotransporter family protein, partial [candidate division NC10 bacterium]|nr:Na/Pi cotransporter family protein [candidate division NC10 bacterium]
GIYTLRKGSDQLFGLRLRTLIQRATRSNLRSLFTGFLMSILTPSSTAIALLAMEAVQAGYIGVHQVLIFMLGANIGFTLTVQLLACKVYVYHSVCIAVGVPLYLFTRRPGLRGTGRILLGVGFLLLSLQILSAAVTPLKESGEVLQVMTVLENHPMWLVVFALILKTLLQSATATIGIAIAMAAQDILPVKAAVAVVLGANLGIAVTALIVGFRQLDTRRVALGNLLFKVCGVAVCVALLPGWVEMLRWISPHGATQVIANAHTMFNVGLALVFTPLTPFVARLAERLAPTPVQREERFGAKHLDRSALESPTLALGQATREILHMADHVSTMLRDSHRAFQGHDPALCAKIQADDDKVDLLNTEVKSFLVALSEQGLSHEESRREVALLGFAGELENVGDTIHNLVELAEKKIKLGVDFSKNGWQDLDELYRKILVNYEIAVAAFTGRDRELAEQLLRHKQFINRWERELRNRHFERLHDGL